MTQGEKLRLEGLYASFIYYQKDYPGGPYKFENRRQPDTEASIDKFGGSYWMIPDNPCLPWHEIASFVIRA
jgi:hypothetical protein